ncbi:DUF6875 domain-containing protein [Streptomyces sp. NPDC101393]|uniref:DUF6875 domain-containing protein n=1 Tax=Streptomyces sp. NPDC101393 TaxID=3366141 RepID=UPI0037F8D1E1
MTVELSISLLEVLGAHGGVMITRNDLSLYSLTDILAEQESLPKEVRDPLVAVADWSCEFLIPGHPELGRSGPVCPYTKPSMGKGHFWYSCPDVGAEPSDVADTVLRYLEWHQEMATAIDERERQFLTFLIVLPAVDPDSPDALDEIQLRLKGEFVQRGIMVGQFHPRCDQPGLWNEDFRPLRSPVPLLAIRYMVPFDLPFLVGHRQHLEAYLHTFAPDIPARVRTYLAELAATAA